MPEVNKKAITKNLSEVIAPRSWSSAHLYLDTAYRRSVHQPVAGGVLVLWKMNDTETMSQEEN